jgi:hypothetical protein
MNVLANEMSKKSKSSTGFNSLSQTRKSACWNKGSFVADWQHAADAKLSVRQQALPVSDAMGRQKVSLIMVRG